MDPDVEPTGTEGEPGESPLPVVVVHPAHTAPVRRVAPATSLAAPVRTGVPVVQAAAVAAGSFVAGAAVAGLVRHRRSARPAVSGGRLARALTRRRGSAPKPQVVEIVGTRSLLVDVHLLGLPTSER